MTRPAPVKISYIDLKAGKDLSAQIQAGLGSEEGCLGIVVISDLPEEFHDLRTKLFNLAHKLANSSEGIKQTLESPETHYSFGWSHGKEKMNGVSALIVGRLGVELIVETGFVQGVLLRQSTSGYP
jgi:hypothetical protein